MTPFQLHSLCGVEWDGIYAMNCDLVRVCKETVATSVKAGVLS
jgi:hypothetical protein